jgi:perosamine synthetase
LIAGLKERGIPSRPYFPAIHHQPYFREIRLVPNRPLPHTDSASESCLALPFFSSMTERQVTKVCAAVREILLGMRTPVPTATEKYREAARLVS